MKLNRIILLFICLSQLACNSSTELIEYDLNAILAPKIKIAKKSELPVMLELCREIPFKFDRIIVVAPYTTAQMIKAHHLDNSKYVEQHLLDKLYQESDCLLLFVKENRIVKYSYVPRFPLDFNYINGTDKIKTITYKMACTQLYVSNKFGEIKLFNKNVD